MEKDRNETTSRKFSKNNDFTPYFRFPYANVLYNDNNNRSPSFFLSSISNSDTYSTLHWAFIKSE